MHRLGRPRFVLFAGLISSALLTLMWIGLNETRASSAFLENVLISQTVEIHRPPPDFPEPADPYHLDREAFPTAVREHDTIEVGRGGLAVRVHVRELDLQGRLLQEGLYDDVLGVVRNRNYITAIELVDDTEPLSVLVEDEELLNRDFVELGQRTVAGLAGREFVRDLGSSSGVVLENRVVVSAEGLLLLDETVEIREGAEALIERREVTSLEIRDLDDADGTFLLSGPPLTVVHDLRTHGPTAATEVATVAALPSGLLQIDAATQSHSAGALSEADLPSASGVGLAALLNGAYSSLVQLNTGHALVMQSRSPSFDEQVRRSIADWVNSRVETVTLADGRELDAWIADGLDGSSLAFLRVGDLLAVVRSYDADIHAVLESALIAR